MKPEKNIVEPSDDSEIDFNVDFFNFDKESNELK